MSTGKKVPHPALWVPTSYLSEGIPFAMAIWVVGSMFSNLGHSDSETALVTGSIGIAWSLKPFWAPFLEMFRTKKFFVLVMELLMAGLLALIGFSLQLPNYFKIIAAVLWVLAFASATQDICVDGVYITSLDKQRQAAWMGVQGAFWNCGRAFGQAMLLWFAGMLISNGTSKHTAWMYAMWLAAAVMAGLAVYHYFMLPTGTITRRPKDATEVVVTFVDTVKAFFQKKAIWGMLIFVFLYRTGEGFLLVEAPLFMQAPLAKGGLGLSLVQKGTLDGLIGTFVSIAGGLVGGYFVSKVGLRRGLLFLALCLNVPHLCYIILSHAVSPTAGLPLPFIYLLVSVEKFGYSFGFIGNMLYMMQQIAPGKYKMTHYAFATALMNLVLVPTQSISGYVADHLGYKSFFIFVLVASIPSIIAAWKAPFPNPPDVEDAEQPAQDTVVEVAPA
jgi:PAT family beta-lactamase induction signal transducer AmpG